MGLSLQFVVVFFALAATFSLTFASHYHGGKRIDEVEIEGEVYCSSDGNKQSSSTRKLSRAKISLSCDGGDTILYKTTTKHDGEFEIEIEGEANQANQAKVDIILDNIAKCAIYVHLPVKTCLLAPSKGFLQAYLDQNVNYDGSEAEFKIHQFKYVSCL